MPHGELGALSSEVRVSDLLLVLVLLILSPPLLALLLFKGDAFVLKLHLLELLIALLGHLVLQHAAHAVHGESLVGISPIRDYHRVVGTFLPQPRTGCSGTSRISAH